MELSISLTLTAVTVYPDRARITGQGAGELAAGSHRLVVSELPLTLEPESVRVSGRGTAQLRILGVDVTRRYYEETPAVRARELEQQIEQLEDELRAVKDNLAGLVAQMKYLDGLRQATTEYARGLARGRTTVEDQARLAGHLQAQDNELRAAGRDLDRQQRDLDKRLTKLRQELAALQSARPRQRYQATVDVEALNAGSFTLELTYVVKQAGWQPLYDVRLLDTAGGSGRALDVTYLAQIKQNTGQDWSNVALSVSTARPVWEQKLPELKPWYVDVYTPPPPPMPTPQPVARAAKVTTAGAPAPAAPMEAMALAAPEVEAEAAVATVQDSGLAVAFNLSGRADLPSDGSPHKATIGQFQLEPKLDYLAIPKLTDAVYRRVTVTNTSNGPLLAGQASLFAGEEFIGTARLDYTPQGDEIELQLGLEERITVKRELTRREVDKALLRDKRQLRYGYKIEAQNLLPVEVKLELHDHVPVARNEQIKVRLEMVTPEAAEKSDLNLFEWRLTLAPGAKQTIRYEYLVEYQRTLRVIGLPD
ncbi:MAG: mucoidy inhibitor MuiA family protein [Chloroflexota bacterium]